MKGTAPLLLAVLASGLFAGRAHADPATLGSIDRTNTVYTAAQVDALLENAGGGASREEVTNFVAEAVAELGSYDPSATLQKLILADLWQRVDALEGSDGTGYVTSNAVEALVAERVASDIAAERDAWAVQHDSLPIQPTTTEQTSTTTASGVSVALSPARATRYYANGSNRTLGIGSFTGVGVNPCVLILQGYSSVSWPSGAKVKTGYSYSTGSDNYFRVYSLAGSVVVERIYP